MSDALLCACVCVHDGARMRRRTLAPLLLLHVVAAARFAAEAADTTGETTGPSILPRERPQRDSTLTPLGFGVRTKVSLRADGFVPVLHLQGDVAIAVNALSGMQGVHARSPVYLLALLLGLLPRTRLLFCASAVLKRRSSADDCSAISRGSFRLLVSVCVLFFFFFPF